MKRPLRADRPRARSGAGRTSCPTASSRAGVEVDRDALAAYDRVCGFRLRDELPATYLHVLAFPLAMELMAGVRLPVLAARARARRQPDRAAAARCAPTSRSTCACGRRTCAPTSAARSSSCVAEAAVDGEVVWRDASTYLHRDGGGGSASSATASPSRRGPSAVWTVPGDIGRRYARVSGDAQPDPPAPAHREGVRAARRDRARHVDQGPLPGRARGPAARRIHCRRALQAPAADPRPRGVLATATASSPSTMPARASRTSAAASHDRMTGSSALTSKELHDRAVKRARHHLDVKFFCDLVKLVPAAQAAAGDLDEAENDVFHLSAHVDDITESGRGRDRGDAAAVLPRVPTQSRRHRLTTSGTARRSGRPSSVGE